MTKEEIIELIRIETVKAQESLDTYEDDDEELYWQLFAVNVAFKLLLKKIGENG